MSGVLYREKFVEEFNVRGFVRFRNLVKISRSKKKKKKRSKRVENNEGENGGGRRRRRMMVEVLEERENGGNGDLSGLLGEEFKGRKWKGFMRLLFLDERYVRRKIYEFFEVVKVKILSFCFFCVLKLGKGFILFLRLGVKLMIVDVLLFKYMLFFF